MTTLGTVCWVMGGTGLVSTMFAVTAQAVGVASDVPWDKLAAGGAALLVTAILVYVLKHQAQQTKDSNATIKEITTEFSKTVKESSATFGETTATLVREGRESHERREAELYSLIRETRNPRSAT